jgi:uroporphyrinogen decarboxylase
MKGIRRENILRVYRHEEPLFVPSINDVDMSFFKVVGEIATEVGVYRDAWGVQWILQEGQPGPIQNESIPPVLEDVTQWREKITFPDLDKADWETAAQEETAKWDRTNKISNVIIPNGLWERYFSLCGFQQALCNILLEPEATFELIGAIADHRVGMLQKIAQYFKPDKIQLHDDYGMERNMFFSVDTWRELIKPHLKKIVDACHDCGMIYEHHSCGYIAPILDDLVEMGIDAWNPVQYANDPPALFKKYRGKLTLVGGFNDRLFVDVAASEEEKEASVREIVRLGAACGTFVPRPASGYEAYLDMINKAIYENNKPIYDRMGLSGPGFEPPVPTGQTGFYIYTSQEKSQ